MVGKLLIITLLSSQILFGQSNTIVCGGNINGVGGNISYTIGQIDYNSNSGTSGIITQGLQQPFEIFSIDINSVDSYNTDINAILYPNPTNEVINLKISDYDLDNLFYQLYDLHGKLLLESKLHSDNSSINIESFADGSYYLKILKQNQILKSFKLIKH